MIDRKIRISENEDKSLTLDVDYGHVGWSRIINVSQLKIEVDMILDEIIEKLATPGVV